MFFGWWIVIASVFSNGTGGAIHWQGFSVFFLPVTESLGLSRFQTSLVFSFARLENGLMGPFTGYLIDRFGPRWMAFFGSLLVGVGYIILATTNTYYQFLIVYIAVISLGASTSFMQASMAVLNTWFIRRRGLVMAINAAGMRGGAAIFIPLLGWLLSVYSWQAVSVGIGLMMIFWVAPFALTYRRSPESYGMQPDGDTPELRAVAERAARSGGAARSDVTWGVREALHTSAYWLLALATTLRLGVTSAIQVHAIAIFVWKSENAVAGAAMLGAVSAIAFPIILLLGWLSDRVARGPLLFVSYTISAVGLVLLNFVEGTIPVFIAFAMFAPAQASASVNWSLVGDLFGRRNFATLRGLLAPMYNIATVVTVAGAGFMYDRTESYSVVLMVGAALLFGAALTFFILKPPTRSTESTTPKPSNS
ncbi:MAG TPA: MFS transporter [Dehalococcoidia bacterium]|nr:MFS transporter [Dehalococcoidia bacterium]MDP6273734.1 MFS transporter [Dehalococcoidia bacterium]MDP7161005.1 MFS transporter [Dehalococcoidia bacterium]MDP7213943.1 MFS transporter [Dehalococcoidia bacterium]MDP7514411.1 MFS transporter [Dehalococcoidia bacterium]